MGGRKTIAGGGLFVFAAQKFRKMQKILHLNQEKQWVAIEKRYYDDEAHLQNLLANDVNILPFDEIGYELPFITIGKEITLDNGSLDLLAISPQGHIALIETKLGKNPEVKRTVVGQILGYAAYLWNKSYEELETTFKKFIISQKIDFQGSLFDYISSKYPNASEAEFKEGIEKRLRLGSFSLLIVVDEANKELVDTANYLNDRTGQEIDFYVMEMELIGDGKEQFLIPRIANPPRKTVTIGTTKVNDNYDRTPISRDVFFSKLSKEGLNLAKELLKLEGQFGIKATWRKNGFSLMSELPKSLITPGWQNNFSYFFIKVGNDPQNNEIQFGYPDWSWGKDKISPVVEDYISFYRSLNGYDPEKKDIKDLSVFDPETIAKFIEHIKNTAQKINDKAD